MPKRGAMTRARHVAPFRNAAGPSRFMMRLQKYTDGKKGSKGFLDFINTQGNKFCLYLLFEGEGGLKHLPCAVNNSSVCVLSLTLLQGLQTSLNHCRGDKRTEWALSSEASCWFLKMWCSLKRAQLTDANLSLFPVQYSAVWVSEVLSGHYYSWNWTTVTQND